MDKYQQAFGVARAIYKAPYTTDDQRDALAGVFPELRESEDERIRKELKEAFEAYDIESRWNGIPIRSIFAWLEKQKEQKPAKCIKDSVEFEEGFKAGRESGLRDGQKYVLNNLDSYGLCKPEKAAFKDFKIPDKILKALEDKYSQMEEWILEHITYPK